MTLVEHGDGWKIEGAGKERARIAYASEEEGKLAVTFEEERRTTLMSSAGRATDHEGNRGRLQCNHHRCWSLWTFVSRIPASSRSRNPSVRRADDFLGKPHACGNVSAVELGCFAHCRPQARAHLDAYCRQNGNHVTKPIPLSRFLGYGHWYQRQVVPDLEQQCVRKLTLMRQALGSA